MSFTGNLKGRFEYIFRQGSGRPAHIIVNSEDYLAALATQFAEPLHLDTLCGKRLKYLVYEMYGSTCAWRSNAIRNACIDCFMQWEPREDDKPLQLPRGDLPF